MLTDEDRAYATTLKVALRKSEFERSRLLIRQLTGWRGSLAKTASGAPGWPDGYVGSLTHKDGWVGVALKRQDEAQSLGIDAEDVARLKLGFESKILTPPESERLGVWEKDGFSRLDLLALIFSFKEALFKAVYPLGAKMFYFHDAEVTRIDRATGGVSARVLIDTSPVTPAGTTVPGHFAFWKKEGKHFVLTATELHGVANAGIGSFERPLR